MGGGGGGGKRKGRLGRMAQENYTKNRDKFISCVAERRLSQQQLR